MRKSKLAERFSKSKIMPLANFSKLSKKLNLNPVIYHPFCPLSETTHKKPWGDLSKYLQHKFWWIKRKILIWVPFQSGARIIRLWVFQYLVVYRVCCTLSGDMGVSIIWGKYVRPLNYHPVFSYLNLGINTICIYHPICLLSEIMPISLELWDWY